MNKLRLGLIASLMSYSLFAHAEPPKLQMIIHQENLVESKALSDQQATPAKELRPAVNARYHDHSVESPKADLIKNQIKSANELILDAELAKPSLEMRPAAVAEQG